MAELDRLTLAGDGATHAQFTDSAPLNTREELAEIERRHLIAAFLERLGYQAAARVLRLNPAGYVEIAASAFPTCEAAMEDVTDAVRDAFTGDGTSVIFVSQHISL